MTRDRIKYELQAQGVTLDFPNSCWRYRGEGQDLRYQSLWDLLDDLVWVELLLGLHGITRQDLMQVETIFSENGRSEPRLQGINEY